jgi:hypothetical protein
MPARDLTGNIVSDSDDKPEPKRVRTQGARAAQALRIAELERQGCTVVVSKTSGATVFRFGGQ